MDLFSVVTLDDVDLNDPSKVWVNLIEDGFNFFIAEVAILGLSYFLEVLDEALPNAEVIYTSSIVRVSLQERDLEAIGSNEVRKLLDLLLRPSLGASEKLSRVLLLELVNRLFELYLGSS